MTYPIATVVYGVPLTEAICDIVIPLDAENYDDFERGHAVWDVDDLLFGNPKMGGLGFESLYSAGPDDDKTAGYLGVALWSDAYWELAAERFTLQPTDEQKKEVADLIESLPQWFRKQLPEPTVCLVWSDS